MGKKGLGIDGLVSQIGAIGRKDKKVRKTELIGSCMSRFDCTMWEVIKCINKAIEEGVIIEEDGYVVFVNGEGNGY